MSDVQLYPLFRGEGVQGCQEKIQEVHEPFYDVRILPGDDTYRFTTLVFPIECQQLKKLEFFLAINPSYTDVGSGLSYNQHFMEDVNLSPDTFQFGSIQVLPSPTPTPEPTSSPSITPTLTPIPKTKS